jgi:solute carrier family 34 (sodium-dependent phosphate cotransporter)
VTEVNFTEAINTTFDSNSTTFLNVTDLRNMTVSIPVKPCAFLFHNRGLSDTMVGIILLIISLVILCGCLILMVKLLNSALKGSMMVVVKKVINADLPGPLSYLTGYIAMLVGAGLTMIVQSSSVFTSALTPLVGIGVIQLERVYPLTLGSNIGTTTTGILASFAASSDRLKPALQIALCHLCFNITGILLFYPIPFMRVPIRLAKIMGNTTAKYRWFAIFYVALMFFLLPMTVFGLSMAGILVMSIVCGIFAAFCVIVVIINVLQKKRPNFLPKVLRNWDFLPYKWMHSLEPFDRVITKVMRAVKSLFCCCSCCKKPEVKPLQKEVEMVLLNTEEGGKTRPSEICLQIKQAQDLTQIPSYISISSYLRTECESGYASRANTPYNTPCMSRLPSYVSFTVGQIPEEDEH